MTSEARKFAVAKSGYTWYLEVDRTLEERHYSSAKTDKGKRYWCYELAVNFHLYARKRTIEQKLMCPNVYCDAKFVELRSLLLQIQDVVCVPGTKINFAFDRFQVKRILEHGQPEYEGWKFHFKNEKACNSFLDICEAYVVRGIQAAEIKASEFAQIAVPKTSKSVVTESRVGQARFRKNLIKYQNTCAVTDFRIERLLRASHIKPWNVANPNERLDSFNGLLLVPNLDALFDDGFISFDKQDHIFISSKLLEEEYATLGLAADMKLRKINGAHASYLAYHFEHVFKP